jgi:phospholipase A1
MKITNFSTTKQTDHVTLAKFVLLTLLVSNISIVSNCLASNLSNCVIGMVEQASDSMTIGEIRKECEKQIEDVAEQVQSQQPSAIDKRLNPETTPFTLMAHKPNYILFGAYNFEGYDATLYQDQFDDPSIDFGDVEAQFQISVKLPILVDVFDKVDVYGAYTNLSFWQLYETDSSPFRETNHEPEAWVQFNSNWKFAGFTNSANLFGIVHQSNGRGGVLSRSWNRIFANFLVERESLALSFKPWYRIPEDDSSDDNPDITDYLGHYEIRAAYKWKEHVFSAMSRNNLESGFTKGAVELSWSFPLWNYPYLKGYIQYFNGYGESLIDYDRRVNKIGIGVSLTDWL